MSDVDATTLESAPNPIYASAFDGLVTTTESPPPTRGAFTETLLIDKLTVPVGRNGPIEPSGIPICPFRLIYPTCSTTTARLYAAFVAVGIVVEFVVVSDGAQNPPIQYQDCAMIC
jgi:hypothetical protein